MLKLERQKNGLDIAVRLRNPERFFNGSFFIALTIALTIHLFAGLLFHIQPFSIGHEMRVYPPAVVHTDLSLEEIESVIIADLEGHKTKTCHHLPPPSSILTLPKIKLPPLSHPFEEQIAVSTNSNPFLSIEQKLEVSGPLPRKKEFLFPVRIQLTGSLKELKPLYELEAKKPYKGGPISQYLARYQVQVYNGEIFWILPKESIGDEKLKPYADKILSQLEFNPLDSISKGIIEIMIEEDKS